MDNQWQPSCSLELLQQRAALLTLVREFFAERQVLEVETPLLASSAVTDPFIRAMAVDDTGAGRRFLQTSPEYAMKRLLASGSGPIYQICKAFRHGEASARHNPEFTMLEWYRPGFDEWNLIDEVEALLRLILPVEGYQRLSYREIFEQLLNVDPHNASVSELAAVARRHANFSFSDNGLDRDGWLDVLITHVIEPALDPAVLTVIYDYPATQSALSQVATDSDGQSIARRFECYFGGVELANGYYELLDAAELSRRATADNRKRKDLGYEQMAEDDKLLAAMQAGMPSCAGVAIGFDRLLMLRQRQRHISAVMSFDFSRA
ncbi:Elongation factor P--(R)-beta-lysine ligase [Sinobacterium norvegicum]|uniref:Elongation factor P--(R)-beta-lysine ligase n=1 Tax=Sinobacterium norvegicum TaxID=1641715 RepID=A0ABM9AEQ3_9GAMM|nr:EF-P lysine aminoacylase EpmA [Sinobacterium norvegicum]CAH0991671.1 Elongation factor P--(R)-beta-lysine ligase [Sinobacterium norvegicum]